MRRSAPTEKPRREHNPLRMHAILSEASLLVDVGEPEVLGYVESLGGELFLESPADVDRLTSVYDRLGTLAMSPAESIRFIKERASGT